uniref:Uncharacterized protein n=1 Tax=Anguilla anguilla TaxID=7936 RepID=A0A0E9XGT9_ANGAN
MEIIMLSQNSFLSFFFCPLEEIPESSVHSSVETKLTWFERPSGSHCIQRGAASGPVLADMARPRKSGGSQNQITKTQRRHCN